MTIAQRLFLVFFIFTANLWATESISTWYTHGANQGVVINVELFLSSTCPHCQKANAFFTNITTTAPYMHVQRHVINEDKEALFRFNQLLTEQHMDDFSVPSIYICNSRWVGFASAETTGKDLLHAIIYCKQQIEKDGTLTQATVDTLRHWGNANKFDSGMFENPSALKYISTIALTDAVSPCAFFSLAAFLALLMLEKLGSKQILASFLFILTLVGAHYWQQAHTSSFYEFLPWLRIPAAITGLLTLYFVIRYFKKKSPDSLYFLLAFLLGFIVFAYQQTCVMNWAYIFEQWLNNQHITYARAQIYQLLYQVLYISPLILLFIVYVLANKIKRIASKQSRFARIGLLFLLAIALCLIIYPSFLSSLVVSVIGLSVLFIVGWFLNLT